eukprot:TRINITY_DN14870_c0_g1_i1.p1 TRINITY_DN14870_c0_g1~~TRINITY_DN14870_c0_g1_i1.p1  ORF type:complete len:111 (+),score=28.74 TRINITY_DN14870_c0_g1_i1:49-333(+)
MPYLIQSLREYDNKMQQIYAKFAAHDKEKEEKEKEDQERAEVGPVTLGGGFVPTLAIMPPPGMMPGFPPTYPPSEIGRAVQQECRDRSRMPSSA